jgi:hypothetical protein
MAKRQVPTLQVLSYCGVPVVTSTEPNAEDNAEDKDWLEYDERSRLTREFFSRIGKPGIDGWRDIALALFIEIFSHNGEQAARRIFNDIAPLPPKRKRAELRDVALLVRLLKMTRSKETKPNIAKLACIVAKENGKLPRDERRGAGSTNAQRLEKHIRMLVRRQREASKGWVLEPGSQLSNPIVEHFPGPADEE